MMDETNYATVVINPNNDQNPFVMAYRGLPLHFVSYEDAIESAKALCNTSDLEICKYMFNGVFEFLIEIRSSDRTIYIDLLKAHTESRDLIYLKNEKSSDEFEVNFPLFCDYKKLEKSIVQPYIEILNGIPDYQQSPQHYNSCAPVASGCVCGYWDDRGYNNLIDGGGSSYPGTEGEDGYWNLIYGELAVDMGYVEDVGTPSSNIDEGINEVWYTRNGYQAPSFQFEKRRPDYDRDDYHEQINNSRPFVYVIGSHATAAVGHGAIWIDSKYGLKKNTQQIDWIRIVHDNNPNTGRDVYISESSYVKGQIFSVKWFPSVPSINYHPAGNKYLKNILTGIASYPNPFNVTNGTSVKNSGTTIRFTLLKSKKVIIRIHNILGQAVRTISLGMKNIGTHSTYWDGKDDYGNIVAEGIYLYDISAGSIRIVNKMIIIQ